MATAPRAILFDLDETILTFGRRRDQLTVVAKDFVAPGDGATVDRLAETVDLHMAAFWADAERREVWRQRPVEAMRTLVAEAFSALASAGASDLGQAAAHQFADAFRTLRTAGIQPFPGAIETLDALRATGVPMALITNGPTEIQRAKIDRFDLARRFDHVQIEGECGFGKPQPRAYRHALDRLGAACHEAWIVGDNLEWEVAAPQKLGLFAIWCDAYGTGLPPDGGVSPDRIIRSLTELHPL
jgi:putative hydrolase of the HAD superfamily